MPVVGIPHTEAAGGCLVPNVLVVGLVCCQALSDGAKLGICSLRLALHDCGQEALSVPSLAGHLLLPLVDGVPRRPHASVVGVLVEREELLDLVLG